MDNELNPPKRQKIQISTSNDKINVIIENPESKKQYRPFDNVPTEIIDCIFKYLPSNDLARMSLTCKRMKEIAEAFFKRRRSRNGCISLQLVKGGKIKRSKNYELFELRFRPLIDEMILDININRIHSTEKLFRFINDNCRKELKSLKLAFNYKKVCSKKPSQIDYFDIIAEQLNNIDKLILFEPPTIQGILKHCKNLKTLWITKKKNDSDNNDWTNVILPKLELFTLNDQRIKNHINLTQFISNANQLKCICINNLSVIYGFLNIATHNFVDVALTFNDTFDLLSMMNAIEKCSKQNQFKNLHLSIYGACNHIELGEVFNRIRTIECVKSLHFCLKENVRNFIFVENQPYLESVCIRFHYERHVPIILNLIKSCPNLIEVRFQIRFFTHVTLFRDVFIMPIVCHLEKLKRFFFGLYKTYQDQIQMRRHVQIMIVNVDKTQLAQAIVNRTPNIVIVPKQATMNSDKIFYMNTIQKICSLCFLSNCLDNFK